MHILQIYKDYAPVLGGIEHHVQVLAEGLAQAGHQSTVLVTNTTAASTVTTEGGVRVLRAARDLHLASTPFSLAMAIMARTVQPDIINLHMPYPPGDLVARAVPGQPPLVVTYHSDIVRQQRLLRLYRPLLEATLSRASRIIATNAPYIESSPFLRPHAAKCRVVPLSVDPRRFTTFDTAAVERLRREVDGPIILSVGVLRYYKGLHILIAALRETPGTLVIVGAGPEAERLKAQAAALGLAGRVRFAGRVPDDELPAYYQAADVFVLPSHLRAEAFGIVLLEAMAAGLPLVTTELGTGTSFVNQHGRTGFVVPPGQPAALARAISVLLANPTLRMHFGQAARAAAAQFTDEQLVQRTVAVYQECG